MPSSVVAEISYDTVLNTLRIIYVSGSVYDYLKVPEEIFLEMKAARSKGIFLNENIKGNFKFKKIS